MHLQAILRFTDSQQQDMLHLRRLFYGKLGQLARERASILQQVDAAEPSGQPSQPMPFNLGFRHTADKLTETKKLADQLCANRAEESRTYMYCVVCLYRCVSLLYTVFSALFTIHRCHCSLSKLCFDVWLPMLAEHKHNIVSLWFHMPARYSACVCSVPCCVLYVNRCLKTLVNMLQEPVCNVADICRFRAACSMQRCWSIRSQGLQT